MHKMRRILIVRPMVIKTAGHLRTCGRIQKANYPKFPLGGTHCFTGLFKMIDIRSTSFQIRFECAEFITIKIRLQDEGSFDVMIASKR